MSIRARNKERQRIRVLDAARELITEAGYARLNMRDLAERAEVSVATLYNSFGSKDAIRQALAVRFMEKIAPEVAETSVLGPVDRLHAMLTTAIDQLTGDSRFYKAGMLAHPDAVFHLDESARSAITIMERIIEYGIERGDFERALNPTIVATHINEVFQRLCWHWATDELSDDLLRARAVYALDIHLLAIAAKTRRAGMIGEMQKIEGQLDLTIRAASESGCS